MTLTSTIQERFDYQREEKWKREGVPPADIGFSRLCGMHPADVQVFRDFTMRGYLVVVRCPKAAARPWHGMLPPKGKAVEEKTGAWGVVVTERKRMLVSDYDLMCFWKTNPGGAGLHRKIFISPPEGRDRGPFAMEGTTIVRELNQKLVSRIQHGCQDDFHSAKNPGVNRERDHFAAFAGGVARHLPTIPACSAFYERHGLPWPYAANGEWAGPGAGA